MKNLDLDDVLDIYKTINVSKKSFAARKTAFLLRKNGIELKHSNEMIKNAFDTRRIDQETEYNPRRGLQNYSRSDSFLSASMGDKLKKLAILRDVLLELKDKFGKEPEWQDSYSRILLSTLDKTLRINEEDGDFTDSQPGVGNVDYVEQLLHMRYRLSFDDLGRLDQQVIKQAILNKDEELLYKDLSKVIGLKKSNKENDNIKTGLESQAPITRNEISTQSYEDLISKVFAGGTTVTKEKNDGKTISITINL
jgi:hypothetical protein